MGKCRKLAHGTAMPHRAEAVIANHIDIHRSVFHTANIEDILYLLYNSLKINLLHELKAGLF